VVLPLGRDLVLGADRVDRARFDAGVAVDALRGVDVELLGVGEAGLVLGGMDAVDRADLDARVVLRADAGLVDHAGHCTASPAFLQQHGKAIPSFGGVS
jgi:hypothetical protein